MRLVSMECQQLSVYVAFITYSRLNPGYPTATYAHPSIWANTVARRNVAAD